MTSLFLKKQFQLNIVSDIGSVALVSLCTLHWQMIKKEQLRRIVAKRKAKKRLFHNKDGIS